MPNINEQYSEFCKNGSTYPGANTGSFNEWVYLITALCGEAGELANEFKKVMRVSGNAKILEYLLNENPNVIYRLRDELGDVLWYVTRLTSVLGLSLEELMLMNAMKLHDRHGDVWPFGAEALEHAKQVAFAKLEENA